MYKQNACSTFVRNRCHRTKVQKKGQEAAALSAILVPKWRNSQRGVRKLLEAVAANEEGLQDSKQGVVTAAELGPAPTLHV